MVWENGQRVVTSVITFDLPLLSCEQLESKFLLYSFVSPAHCLAEIMCAINDC